MAWPPAIVARAPTLADLPAVHALLCSVEQHDIGEVRSEVEWIAASWRAPYVDLARDVQGRSLRTIRARLGELSEEQLLAMVPPPQRALTAEGIPQPPPAPSYPAVSWELVALADGLVLMVNPAVGPLVRRVADEIYRHYSAAPPRQGPT